MKRTSSITISMLLQISLIVSLAFGFHAPGVHAKDATTAQETSLSEEEMRASLRALQAFTNTLQTAQQKQARERIDAQVLLAHTGKDMHKIYAWVRNHTKLVAYRGSLRGPEGVLQDRTGNSLDRALLLDHLLHLAGHQTRLAHGPMSQEQAFALASDTHLPSKFQSPKINYPDTSSTDDTELTLAVIMQTAFDRIEQQSPELLQQLAPHRAKLEAQQAKELQTAANALRDHWWVQVRINKDGGNDWINLDATLAEPGLARIEAQETFSSSKLPAKLQHQVTLRVILETWENEQTSETTLLEFTAPATEYAKQTIFIGHTPLGLDQKKLFETADTPALLDQAGQAKAWLPLLVVDNKIAQAEYFFTAEGEVLASQAENLKAYQSAQGLSQIGNSMGGALGKLSKTFDLSTESDDTEADHKTPDDTETDPQPQTKPLSNKITAEWLEYEIHIPGESSRIIRREVFDLIGPQARAEGKLKPPKLADQQAQQRIASLLGGTRIRVTNAKASREAITEQLAKKLTELQPLIEKLARSPNNLSASDASKYYPAIQTLQIDLDALSLLRWSWNWGSDAVYLNQPNILALRQHATITAANEWRALRTIDIVTNEVGVRTIAGMDPFQARVMQGVTDTVVEAALAKQEKRSLNTSVLHELAASQNIPRITLLPDSKAKKIPKHSEQATARISQDLTAGNIVVLPNKAVQLNNNDALAWWRIDPNSGTTLGITSDGTGGAVEYGQALTLSALTIGTAYVVLKLALHNFNASIGLKLTDFLNQSVVSGSGEGTGDDGETTSQPPAEDTTVPSTPTPTGSGDEDPESSGKGADESLPEVKKAVNTNLQHASNRGVERGIFTDKKAADKVLRDLSRQISREGKFPSGTIRDPAHADRVLVPVGNNGRAVYQVGKNGTAKLKTVLKNL